MKFWMIIAPLPLWRHPTSLSAALFKAQLGTHTSLLKRPFFGPCWTPSRIQADQSQNSLFWQITEQFILTNHRTVHSDQSQTTHQHSGPNKRSWLGPVKPAHKRFQEQRDDIRACWTALHPAPTSNTFRGTNLMGRNYSLSGGKPR
jgi:hypothetical protein